MDEEIEERMILLIDSSHIMRAGGDIPILFNRILPGLPRGTLVHVHDIFLPYEYPHSYQMRLYTEQYILQALLAHSDRYRIIFSTQLMARERTPQMQECICGAVGAEDAYSGPSFWFEVV